MSPRNVVWVTFGDIRALPDHTLYSDTASCRYRVLLPMQHLPAGWNAAAVALRPGDVPNTDESDKLSRADIVIFSKSFDETNETFARATQARGGKVIFDICDHHFNHAQLGPHYRRMAQLADMVVCNTSAMAEISRRYTSKPLRIIADPVEGAPGKARFAPGETLKLLWFGHPSNLDSLDAAIPSLLQSSTHTKLHLTLLTLLKPEIISHAESITAHSKGALRVECRPWSLALQSALLEATDAVIIPSLAEEKKQVKSSNRMVESLNAGRAVIAHALPSYAPFSEWAYVGPDLCEGIAWLLRERALIPALIEQAQHFIDKTYAPSVIGRQWHTALGGLA